MPEKIKKIFYIAHCRWPNEKAHSLQIAKMCEAFRRAGVGVELIVPRKRGAIFENPFGFYGLRETFSLTRLWTVDIVPTAAWGFFISSFVFGWSAFFYLWPKRKEGILYSIDLDPLSFVGLLFLRCSVFFEKKTILNRLLFRKMGGAFAVNEAIKTDLVVNFPWLKDKIIVCPNGVDLEEDTEIDKTVSRQKLEIPVGAKAVVYTGSFQSWKGIETIVEAAKKLPAIDFYLVGGSVQELTQLLSGPVPSRVHCLEARPHSEMPWWRAAADLLLVTGTKKDRYSYYHTSPMKLFEYLAARRPIVASRTPAIEQAVSDQEVFFCESDDVEDLAETIEEVFVHPELALKKAELAYGKARQYSWANRVRITLDFINQQL